jgi:hypothetical protein
MTVYFTPNVRVVGDEVMARSVPDVVGGSTLFQRIRQLASGVSTVLCHASPTVIQLEPTRPDGLPVAVYRSCGRQTVCIGNWYDDVDDDAVVLKLVEKAIHGSLRLRMDSDGRTFHTFAVETLEADGIWIEVGEMAVGYWFWKKPTRVIKYLCNEFADQRLTRQDPDILSGSAAHR